ncbi:MAG TPA: Gfo/Idh/MocA family oxidoreductase [Longimicrobiales bacterium]|nr:Gfo/Idh/MocA family oxidoreductase [Longimicrobiales bacterium]
MAEVNVAMIGYAFMGRAHSNAWRQVGRFFSPRLTPRMKVLCGRTAENVQAAAAQLGWDEWSTDWKRVVRRDDIHIVDICTPGDSHAEIAIAAARAGKVVLCEKPLANSVREAERMLSAVRRAGVIHMLCHNYRKVPAVMLARRLIEEGRLGTIRHFRGTYLQDWIVDPEFPLVWRLDRDQAGSGALGDIGSHVIDLARYLVGEIDEVAAALETFITERPLPDRSGRTGTVTVDDAAIALLRFENGAIGTLEATRMAPGRKNHNRFEINGSKGSLAFDLERMNELELYLESDPASIRGFRTILVTDPEHPYMQAWWPPGHVIGWEHTFTHVVYELLKAMADDRLPTPNFEDGVRNQRVLAAIERAAEKRRWVEV